MKKKAIKVIKRNDGQPKEPVATKVKPKKKRTIENTVQSWIIERRENNDTEDRVRNSQFAAYNSTPIPSEAV